MITTLHTWALVLAGGAGTRLSSLTVAADGVPVPKQYCSLHGARTLLDDTLSRARRVAAPARTLCVVAREHARWWEPLSAQLPRTGIVVQPRNLGTGIGIMLATAQLAARDGDAIAVLLPSDHFVGDERVLEQAIVRAIAHIHREPEHCVLIGIAPDEADSELGYIVPGAGFGARPVARFVEKPDEQLAGRLVDQGALWNSFIVVAGVGALRAMFARAHDKLMRHVERAVARDGSIAGRALERIYAHLPEVDFSRHVVPGNEHRLRVLRAAPCGWTDLGTPRRVARCLETLGVHWIGARATQEAERPLELAQACRRLGLAR